MEVLKAETPAETLMATAAYNAENNSLTLSWNAGDTAGTYYVYKYHMDTNQLSKAKIVTGKTECTLRKIESGKEYAFIVSTKELSNKYGYTGAPSLIITIPYAE